MGNPLPDELVTHVNLPFTGYYTEIEGIGHRNGCTGPDWLDKFLNAKSEIQLCQRDSPKCMLAKLIYIANNKPEIILGILESIWSEYRKRNTWDNLFKNLRVPIVARDSSSTKTLDMTFLPLPQLCSVAGLLGLDAGFGFLNELAGLIDAAASQWSFLEHFGVGVNAGISFWLNLLKQA